MRQRCDNSNNPAYEAYGGRGIRVCERWRDSFEVFYTDVGPRPSLGHSLDRIDNDGHYEPGNVRWTTQLQQSNNQRSNRILTHNGESHTLSEWARRVGLQAGTLRRRLLHHKWPIRKALHHPLRPKRQ